MRVLIVTPAPSGSLKGNRITAQRWGGLLSGLGHAVTIAEQFDGQSCDVLVALHARKSARSIRRFRAAVPDTPIVLALTGTDLYGDIHINKRAKESLELADRLVLLQEHGRRELPKHLRTKARVIHQSVSWMRPPAVPLKSVFEICVMGHLRAVKDPFRAAMAARRLPSSSRIRIVQIGAALTTAMEKRARREMEINHRYQWLGELSRQAALKRLARCRLLVLTSKLEGGANVISEAIVLGVPVISSRISGSIGLLGSGYPGYFPVGDTRVLTKMLSRAEQEPKVLRQLTSRCQELKPLFDPRAEQACWQQLLDEFAIVVVRSANKTNPP